MDIGKFFSIRDFFNYYVAGVIWLLVLALACFWLPDSLPATLALDELTQQVSKLGPVVGGILVIVLPYVTGFTFSPLCNHATRRLRWVCGDPVKWITDFSDRGNQKYKAKRLARPAFARISELAGRTFGYVIKSEYLWFSPIRAYAVDKGGSASDLAVRAYDLMNLAEGLLLPIPLLGAVLVGGSLTQLPMIWRVISSILVFAAAFAALASRYLRLRRYWAKHTYYAFLVLNTTDREKVKNRDG